MRILHTVDEEAWWDVARKCEYATFFHTPLWHKLAVMTNPKSKDVSLEINLSSGVRAILPLLEIKNIKGVGSTIYSTFAGCYGDLIADGPIAEEDRQHIYEHLFSRLVARVQINGNPLVDEQITCSKYSSTSDFTHVLHLDPTFDSVYSNFSKGHRSSYKRGRKMGVTVRAAATLDDYNAYYLAYQDSIERWGSRTSTIYPQELFVNGFYLARDYPENIKLWLAEVDHQVIGGAWVFYWNQHADNWHGASYKDFFDHYPNNVLHTEIIKDAFARGYRYYDFNPSGGFENVARFKGRFGAEKQHFLRWKYETEILQVGRKVASFLR